MIRVSAFRLGVICLALNATIQLWPHDVHLTQRDMLETHGLSVLLFHNSYHKVFGDQKMSGLEIILEDQRIATNGDVRLSPTPAQWDPIPEFESRERGSGGDEIVALCKYADQGLSYRLDLRPETGGFRLPVQLDSPLPNSLVGKAGLNLEFLPSLYFGKSYVAGDEAGILPRHADGPMERTSDSKFEPLPLVQGESLVLSPEEPSTRVTIS